MPSSVDISSSTLKLLRHNWEQLKEFSLYGLYQECDVKQYDFGSDEEMAMYIMKVAKEKREPLINQITA